MKIRGNRAMETHRRPYNLRLECAYVHDVSLSFLEPRAIFEALEVGGELLSVH